MISVNRLEVNFEKNLQCLCLLHDGHWSEIKHQNQKMKKEELKRKGFLKHFG